MTRATDHREDRHQRSEAALGDRRLSRLVDELVRVADPERIILFGSRARGDADERSDVDVAIDAPALTDAQWFQVLDVIDNADTLLPIEVVRFQRVEDRFKQNILREGLTLYERHKA